MSSFKRAKGSDSKKRARIVLIYDSDECRGFITEATEVIFTHDISRIPNDAFEGYTDLVRVSITESLNAIGDHAFSKCTSLKKVDLSKSSIFLKEVLYDSS